MSKVIDWNYVCSDIRRVLNEHMINLTVMKCLMDTNKVFVTGTIIATGEGVDFKIFYGGYYYELQRFGSHIGITDADRIDISLIQKGNPGNLKNRKGGSLNV